MAEKIKVQMYLDADTVEKVDDLARLMNNSRAGICAFCVTETIRDDYWLVKHVSAPLSKMLDRWGMKRAAAALPKGGAE